MAGNNNYSAQTGNYIKVGKLVTLSFRITLYEKDTLMSCVILIGGLPYIPNKTYYYGIIALRNFTLTSDERVFVTTIANNNRLELQRQVNTELGNINVSRLNNNTEISGSITYEIA